MFTLISVAFVEFIVFFSENASGRAIDVTAVDKIVLNKAIKLLESYSSGF
jgi:hypothetical protein